MRQTIFDSTLAKYLDRNSEVPLEYVISKPFTVDYNSPVRLILTCPIEADTQCCFQVLRRPAPAMSKYAATMDGIYPRLVAQTGVNVPLPRVKRYVELGQEWDATNKAPTQNVYHYIEIAQEGSYILYAHRDRNPAVFDNHKPITVEAYWYGDDNLC